MDGQRAMGFTREALRAPRATAGANVPGMVAGTDDR